MQEAERWDRLEVNLGAVLASLQDPDGGDHLILELPGGDDECAPYARFAGFGDGSMLRAELNWHVARPLADAAELAREVVRGLRVTFGVVHPELLTYRAWGPNAAAAEALGLCSTLDVPAELPADGGEGAGDVATMPALVPGDRAALLDMVAGVLGAKYDGEAQVDTDGDFVLGHLDQVVWVRALEDQPAVQILARVAHDVPSRRTTAVELALLNRDNLWVRWTLREREVWQSLVLPGLPFVPFHLGEMLDVFSQSLAATRDDLALRLGAKAA